MAASRIVRGSAIACALALAGAACGHGSDSVASIDGGRLDASEASSSPTDGSTEHTSPTRVRVMAANTTSGNNQSYELPGIHIFEGLAPDVVLIQEFNYAAGGPRALVDTAFGKDFAMYVEPRTGGIPNGVISRYPIVAAGAWTDASVSDRAFVYARIDVPGPVDLWAVSVHLLTSGATQRNVEATQLAGYVKSNVPAGDYLVVGGDFNTDTTSEPALATLSALVDAAPPWPADQSGNSNTSINRNHPHDYVLSRSNLGARAAPVAIGGASFPAGLVFDSRVYTPLADVAPVVATDSGAVGMQHMPVLRDFMLGG